MAAIPKDLKFLLFGMGPKFHAAVAMVIEILAIACLVLGIISSVKEEAIGLWPSYWLLAAIVFFIWGLWAWLCAYAAAKE